VQKGERLEKEWNEQLTAYQEAYPDEANELQRAMKGELPVDWDANLPVYEPGEDHLATRAASGEVLNGIAQSIPYLCGGSADLAVSNKTHIENRDHFPQETYAGRSIWFGVREFAMAAALNRMPLHGGVKLYAGTLFVFS